MGFGEDSVYTALPLSYAAREVVSVKIKHIKIKYEKEIVNTVMKKPQ